MPISFRTYFFIALIVGGMTYGFALLFGDGVAAWALERQAEAALRSQRIFELLAFEPLYFIMAEETRLSGALAAGLLWPIFFVVLLLNLTGAVVLSMIGATASMDNPVLTPRRGG